MILAFTIKYPRIISFELVESKGSLQIETHNYNHSHNILRLFDVLPTFPFTSSETMRDYYLQTWYIGVASRVAKRLKA